jgi:hypothetical protein
VPTRRVDGDLERSHGLDHRIGLGYQKVRMSQAKAHGGVKNVVLLHGGFVDGSGWQGVYDTLKKDGYAVSIVQNPTIS